MLHLEKLLCDELKRNLRDGGAPQIPAGGDLLWRWFLDLNRSRRHHMGGPEAITYAEIAAYGTVNRWPLEPHHVAILRAMDAVYLECAYAKTAKAPEGVKTLTLPSQHAMTTGLFDAMFG